MLSEPLSQRTLDDANVGVFHDEFDEAVLLDSEQGKHFARTLLCNLISNRLCH